MNTKAATPKQILFITSLIAERDRPGFPAPVASLVATHASGGLLASQASWLIEALSKMPKAAVSKSSPAEKGYYLLGDVVHVVVSSHETGKLYSKKLVVRDGKGKWEYAPGAVYNLKPEQKLTVEEAAKLGKHHGCCMICGATLTDEKSISVGIGPTCLKKLK